MHKFIISDPDKCTGCGICELICSASKDGAFNPKISRIRTVKIEPWVDMALVCRFCEDPACVRSCPRKALRQDEKDGLIVVDEIKCDGCGWCIEACKFGALALNPTKKAVVVCDLCGGDPLCVKYCIAEALELTTLDAMSAKARKSVVVELFRNELVKERGQKE